MMIGGIPTDRNAALAITADGVSAYPRVFKQIIDVLFVIASAPVWLPVVALAALAIMSDGQSAFYRQERVGKNGRIFRLWKLRTMVVDADARLEAYLAANPEARVEWAATQKLKNDPRVTAVGRLLRKTSLDELPQLFNVLLGDMSIVGPRPIMMTQKDLYHGESYYNMRPGLTGLWQVSARNETRFADRARYDNLYAASVSFVGDLGIMLRTVVVMLRGTGY